MLDTLVEEYTIDKDNKVTIKLSIPILEDIKEDADSCRQLLPSL